MTLEKSLSKLFQHFFFHRLVKSFIHQNGTKVVLGDCSKNTTKTSVPLYSSMWGKWGTPIDYLHQKPSKIEHHLTWKIVWFNWSWEVEGNTCILGCLIRRKQEKQKLLTMSLSLIWQAKQKGKGKNRKTQKHIF